MASTVAADFAFEPKVWQDHVRAYFDKKLVHGSVAARDTTLRDDAGAGETINFPFFKAIGAAQEPGESEGLAVDKLTDDSFSATVKEVGKAVGIKKKAFKKSAASQERIVSEITEQIGRVHAEKVDADLLAEASAAGNFHQGYLATAAGDVMNARTLNQARIVSFGDKAGDAVVCFLHSLQFLDLMNDTTSGFMKADANDPMYLVQGFMGRILGMAIVVADSVPKRGAQIGGKDAYDALMHKVNPYGFIVKQDMEMDRDYDILQREWVFTGNEWYAVKSFHGKIAAADRRTSKVSTTVST